jgi:hypothetical protein
MSVTVFIDRNLLHWGTVAEEVEVHKGNIFVTGVLDHCFDASVADLAQGYVQTRCLLGLDRQGAGLLREGQYSGGEHGETHIGYLDTAECKYLTLSFVQVIGLGFVYLDCRVVDIVISPYGGQDALIYRFLKAFYQDFSTKWAPLS